MPTSDDTITIAITIVSINTPLSWEFINQQWHRVHCPLTAYDPIRIDIDCFCSGVKELPDSVGHLPVGDLAPDLAVVICNLQENEDIRE